MDHFLEDIGDILLTTFETMDQQYAQHETAQDVPNHIQQGGAYQSTSDAPNCFDVLNGRGQGVQRHPGNIKYRTLVSLSKGLYATCPKSDKLKISKGIVKAVREMGGQFLELDKRAGVYGDIGDKKALAKTSQSLRENLTKIRRQLLSGHSSSSIYDTSLLKMYRPGTPIPAEEYFGYSIQVLESIYQSDETIDAPDQSYSPQTHGFRMSPIPSVEPV